MNISSKFRQNTFQLTLLFWGTGLLLLTILLMALNAESKMRSLTVLLGTFLQVPTFWGLHFIFSLIYRAIPSKKINWIVLFIETLLLITTAIVEIPVLFFLKCIFDSNLAISILATNTNEAQEFLISLGIAPLAALQLFILLSLAGCCYAVTRIQRNAKLQQKLHWISHPSHYLVFICIIFWGTFTAYYGYRKYTGIAYPTKRIATTYDRFIWSSAIALKDKYDLKDNLIKLKEESDFLGMTHNTTVNEPLKVVIILGESARADFMSAYGYERPTTPWLDSISKNTEDLVLFNDVCSSASSTILSCQRIFTYWNNAPGQQWYDFPDLTNTLAHCGYYTQWITNQKIADMCAVEKSIASSAHDVHATNKVMDFYQDPYDETLLPELERHDGLKNTAKKDNNSLTVIHLMGSHMSYKQRYPKTFDFFKAKDIKECLTDDAKNQKAAYLNTLRYTDYLLEKMIKHYSSQRALVFYFSDHGEMIDEPQQRGFFGHSINVDHPTVDVPFFVYATPQLRKEHPELWERIKKAQFRPISTAWFTNSLTSLLGIRTKYNDERYNFFSDKFANPTRIAVQGDERHTVPPLKQKRVKG